MNPMGSTREIGGDPGYHCPKCRRPMPDAIQLNWTSPFEATWIVGYCAHCSRRFHQDAQTGEFESYTWAPLCHVCGREVDLDQLRSDEVDRFYHCSAHPRESWQLVNYQWIWRGSVASPSAL
jgi:DNA-directed RNA polymerase subunit RPC12/RpoP